MDFSSCLQFKASFCAGLVQGQDSVGCRLWPLGAGFTCLQGGGFKDVWACFLDGWLNPTIWCMVYETATLWKMFGNFQPENWGSDPKFDLRICFRWVAQPPTIVVFVCGKLFGDSWKGSGFPAVLWDFSISMVAYLLEELDCSTAVTQGFLANPMCWPS